MSADVVAGLKWERPRLDVPAAVGEEEVTGIFRFTNTGNDPVAIMRVRSSCGCTVPALDQDVYAPGESGELKAILTVGERAGPQRVVLTVNTDSPGHPTTRLIFQTNIPEVVKLRPRVQVWRQGSARDWREVSIETDPAYTVSLSGDSEADFLFDHELNPVPKTPGSYLLRLRPKGTTERSQTKLIIQVKLPDGKKAVSTIQLLIR
ncbi:DUF1573 domain-containing protein [Ruficoccus amylovorans]|uniref:DUF1573 domain-containing protein n=1 Tax=Ruficoccus amylovorans TaxID=1804625 RepID=A0A842HB40_9BACT|nr:DUF1573 domain-containing protein [Ruficoccus amylovorans]